MTLEHDLDTIPICPAVKKMPMEQAGAQKRARQNMLHQTKMPMGFQTR